MSKGGRALHSAHLGPAEEVSQANSDPLLVQRKYFQNEDEDLPGEMHGKSNSQKIYRNRGEGILRNKEF